MVIVDRIQAGPSDGPPPISRDVVYPPVPEHNVFPPTEGLDSAELAAIRHANSSQAAEERIARHKAAITPEKMSMAQKRAAKAAAVIALKRKDELVVQTEAQRVLREIGFDLGVDLPVDQENVIQYVIDQSDRAVKIEVAATLQQKLETMVDREDLIASVLENFPEAQAAVQLAVKKTPLRMRTALPMTELLQQIEDSESNIVDQRVADAEAANPPTFKRAFLHMGDKVLSRIKGAYPRREIVVETPEIQEA